MTQAVDTTYSGFASDPAYVASNEGYVTRLPLGRVTRILDLCGGTGAVGRLLLEAAAPEASLYQIDLDPVQNGLAAQNYSQLGYAVRQIDAPDTSYAPKPRSVTLQLGSASDLPFPENTFDCVNIANAIHLFSEKERLVGAISRVLRPGGVFAFNTGFYAGCWPPLTHQVYFEWVKEALAWIARRSAEQVAAGGPPIKRQRVKSQVSAVAFQNRWPTLDEWRTMLGNAGLEVRHLDERPVSFDHSSLAAVGAYSGLVEAQLSGYPVEIASQALAGTAAAALEGAGVSSVQHNWLEACSVKRGD
jgi:ubiquinone/menaquinone biosynthesis C-methylase UbiE